MVLSSPGPNADEFLFALGGGWYETGLWARVGAALSVRSRHCSVSSCLAESASVVSFAELGTKLDWLKFGSEPNCTSPTGTRGRWLWNRLLLKVPSGMLLRGLWLF